MMSKGQTRKKNAQKLKEEILSEADLVCATLSGAGSKVLTYYVIDACCCCICHG